MRRLSLCLLLLANILACPTRAAKPETKGTEITFLDGSRFEGAVSEVYGALVFIEGPKFFRVLSVSQLSDASLELVADHLLSRPQQRVSWGQSKDPAAVALRKRVSIIRNGKVEAYAPDDQPAPEFYLIYFSASWCGPCRRFTPKLIKAYEQFKADYGDHIELFFFSRDESKADQIDYVKSHAMPWPFVNYTQVDSIANLSKLMGNGIPCLVAVSRSGKVLYHSYEGKEYVGPESVLEKTEELLRVVYGRSVKSRPELHRLQVILHRRSAQGGDKSNEPWVVGLDMSHYQTLKLGELHARVRLDAKGLVSSAEVLDKLDSVLRDELERDISNWLFLPRIEKGVAVESEREVTLSLR